MTDEQTRDVIDRLFFCSRDEYFRSGYESVFANGIAEAVRARSADALDAIRDRVFDARTAPELAAQAMEAIGGLDDVATREERRRLLEQGLSHISSWVRDAALCGLADIGDARSVPVLRAAEASEPIQELRYAYGQAIDQLEASATSKGNE